MAPTDPRAWRRVALALLAVGWGANQFAPMLVVYARDRDLGPGALAALFGVYAAGLIPGLLIGGRASDHHGRRAIVLPWVLLSPVATVGLMLGAETTWLLGPARGLAGVCSGVVFAAGSAWVQELSADRPVAVGARRASMSLSAGFGLGPLACGVLAAMLPSPLVLPYVAHLVLAAVALVALLGAPETRPARGRQDTRARSAWAAARAHPDWLRATLPVAPWTFGAAAISFAALPTLVGGVGPAWAGALTALTLATGIAVQPRAATLSARTGARIGFAFAVAGIGAGIGAELLEAPGALAVTAPLLGVAYGTILVTGLRETQRVAPEAERGALVAVFYALTYVGFALPLLLALVARPFGDAGALACAAALAALCALSSRRSSTRGVTAL